MRSRGAVRVTAAPRVRGLLLDKDGPIVPLHPTWSAWAGRVLDSLEGQAPRASLAQVLDVDVTTGRLEPDGLLAVGTVAAVEAALVSVVFAHGGASAAGARGKVRSALRSADRRMTGVPLVAADGVRDLLLHCRTCAIPVAVVTNDTRASTQVQLETLGLADLVTVTVCGDDGHDPKPSGEMLRAACAALGIEPADALMVGDTLVDRLAAEDADTPFVVVREPRPSWSSRPVSVVRSVDELIPLLAPKGAGGASPA